MAVAIVLGGCLLLLCTCAEQEHPTAIPTASLPSARTAVPAPTTLPTLTDMPVPSLLPSSEPGLPSAVDLAIQVPEIIQIAPDETTIYTLTLHNHGPDPATGVVLTATLPAGVIPVWTQPAQPVCSRQSGHVACDVGDLQGNDAVVVTLDLSVGGTGTVVTSTQLAGVTVARSVPTCSIDRDAIQSRIICRLANLPPDREVPIRVAVDVDAQTTGALVHTATVVANEADPDPSNNHAISTMTVGASEPAAGVGTSTDVDLVVQAGGPTSVSAGQPVTYTFTITNQGAVDATGVHLEYVLPPATILNAYAPTLPRCEQQGEMLTCYLPDLDNGGTISFTLVITGHGEQPMIMELDPLRGWPLCTVLKEETYLHIVNCELGRLKPGQTTQVHLNLTAKGMQDRQMVNTASVRANETGPNLLDNTDSLTVTVQVAADLWLASSMAEPSPAGETISYTLTVGNDGPSIATYVVLTDTWPTGTRLVSAVPSQGQGCRVEEGAELVHIVCDLVHLNAGEMVTVTMAVNLDELLAPVEPIQHTAKVAAEQPDPDPTDNELTDLGLR